MVKMATAFQLSHQANMERYRQLLQTHLTAQEWAFIERRLQEEQSALKRHRKRDVSINLSDHVV